MTELVPRGAAIVPEHLTWQKIPGTADTWLFPCIRKPSVTCSNTYLVSAPDQIIVIDPGTDPVQMRVVHDEIVGLLRRKDRPLFVYLTHCHVDHSHGLASFMSDSPVTVHVAVQEEGARALLTMDRGVTQAETYGVQLTPIPCAVPLLTAQHKARGGETTILLADGERLVLAGGTVPLPGLAELHKQSIRIGGTDLLEIYHTPGHSPDSISLRIGDYLFPGDLLFAANPGLAGIPGWNREHLVLSLQQIHLMVASGEVSLVLAGHGKPLNPQKCAGIVRAMSAEAAELVDIMVLDSARFGYLGEFSVLLLEEAGTAFSTIAGRLCAVSHCLEQLEESAEAARLMSLMDMDAIDELVDDFSRTAEAIRTGHIPGIVLIQKGVQFSRKIEELFVAEGISHLVDTSLLRSAQHLLTDFLNAARGVRFRDQCGREELNAVLADLLRELQGARPNSDDLYDALDDDRRYVYELSRRIACRSPLNEVAVRVVSGGGALFVTIVRDGFSDALTMLLEQLAFAGQREIILTTGRQGATVRLDIALREGVLSGLNPERLQLLAFYFSHFDGTMRQEESDGEMRFVIELPAADPAGTT